MSVFNLPERVLQRAVHRLLSVTGARWHCTDGAEIQILSPGMINVSAGPDITGMAILCNGVVLIGDAEFHVYSSEWYHHEHHHDPAYANVLLHIVLEDDAAHSIANARTLIMPAKHVTSALRGQQADIDQTAESADEVQRAAIARLQRHSSNIGRAIRRVGIVDALRGATSEWFQRLTAKNHHPLREELLLDVRSRIATSALGVLSLNIAKIHPREILSAIDAAESARIAVEGADIRRELLVNVVLPHALTHAPLAQRIMLLTWYWSAKARRPYGVLRRRFPTLHQIYVWQQQGMLEVSRRVLP